MSRDLAVVPEQHLAVAVNEGMNPIVASLIDWADSARAAHSIAVSLVDTSFCPAAFKGKPNEATAAILAGAEVGLSPMAALRAFDVIQGTAAPRAITQRALVQSQGHDTWLVEASDTRAIVEGQRRGSTHVQRSVWTIQRAQQLGLTTKDNWKRQPGAMLVARASSECCRLIAADAMLGLPYSAEELMDGFGADTDTPAEPAKRRTAKRAEPPVTPEPLLDEDPTPETPAEAAAEAATDQGDDTPAPSITKAQLTKLNIQLQEAGYGDRDEKLQFLTGTLGRDIRSSLDLTKSEAMSLIDMFEQSPEPPL